MSKPNIIWIYCDELRTDALGCYGNEWTEMRTPNIDFIAESGIRYTNCFCNSPVCVASRTSVLTGLYPEDTGVYHNEAYWPGYELPDPPLTFPEVFARHGYATANFGKVHAPHALQPWMHSESEGSGMREFFEYADPEELDIMRPPGVPTLMLGGRYPVNRPYPPERVTNNALRWLARAEGPYLVRISYLQPHTPVFPCPPYDSRYMDGNFPDRIDDAPASSAFEREFARILRGNELSPQQIFMIQVYYYGLVAWIDAQVGQILDFLRASDQLAQTILVFDADHGTSLGEAGRYQKQTFAPEVHRVPRLLCWPGTVPAGQVVDDISESLDLAQTLFGLAGIRSPAQFKGRDLLSSEAPDAVYATIGYGWRESRTFPNLGVGEYTGGHGWPRRACIRTARYRLDKNVRIDGRPATEAEEDVFLADVLADPKERTNLAAAPDVQDVLSALSQKLDAHTAGAVELSKVGSV